MPSPDEELQALADRGELRAKGNEQIRKALEVTERRWIVLQAKEIAIHQPMSAAQFKELCEAIRDFCAGEPPA